MERFVEQYGLSVYDANILAETRELAKYFEECVIIGRKKGGDIPPKKIANWLINKGIASDDIHPDDMMQKISAAMTQTQIPEKELDQVVQDVLSQNIKAIEDYKSGKVQVLMYLVGQIMRKYPQGDAGMIRKFLEKRIR